MYGLVLEGGGAKGSYQVGAYKAINECGLEISAVAGTSIGALNGAMIVQGDFEECLELWDDIRYSDIIRDNDQELNRLLHSKPDIHTVKMVADKLRGVISNKGFDIAPFRNMIARYTREDEIRNSPIEFGIATYNLTDRIPMELFKEDIPCGEMKDYLLASSYMPFFKIEKIGGKTLLDGWFHDNLPYHMLLRKGYTNLIIVRTHQMNPGELEDIKDLDPIIVYPKEDLGRAFDLDSSKIKRNMKMGYCDALKEIRDLKGRRYYVRPEGEKFYFQYLESIGNDKIEELCKLLHIDSKPGLSILFGHIIPRLGSMMDIEEGYDYETFIIYIIEYILEAGEVERFEVYSFEELTRMLNQNNGRFRKREYSRYDNIMNRFGNLVPFNRDEILLEAARIIFMD
ncbi:patatin-like phospholipase family protein [Gudongella sp. DL1XJH-153]|uniref:patatin-like phospholipase family protein n=1 Tax=Gudongella sp. DL1XJH-153 TaxID=3409804 RepID=UPI003BB65CCB